MARVVKFYSSYNEPETIGCPTGDGFENEYQLKIVDGVEVLVKQKERRNLQAEIDASKDSCDIAKIIEKYVITGDESIINEVDTFYGDFTKAPKSILEAKQMMFDAQNSFDSLSPRVKAIFNNDVNKFMSDPDALSKIKSVYGNVSKTSNVKVVSGDVNNVNSNSIEKSEVVNNE